MKTQNFGRAPLTIYPIPFVCSAFSRPFLSPGCLQNYRENRENGDPIDNPKRSFPSAGFDVLDIKDSNWQGPNKWPDKQGRHWWKLILNDGQIVNDFYWMKDEARGWPDKSDENRYWFVICHEPSSTIIKGFSSNPDYQKGFPENIKTGLFKTKKYYWRYIQYTECGAIKDWMEEKDRNYLARMKRKEETKDRLAQQQKAKEETAKLAKIEEAKQQAEREQHELIKQQQYQP